MSGRWIALIAGGVVLIAVAIALLVLTRTPSASDTQPSPTSSAPNAHDTPRPRTPNSAPQLAQQDPAPAQGAPPAAGSDDEAPIDKLGGIEALSTDMAAGHWPDALADCKDPQVALVGAKSCALAGCQMHNFSQARAYFNKVAAADREDVAAQCDALHVNLRATPHSMFGHGHGPGHSFGRPPGGQQPQAPGPPESSPQP